MTIRRLTNRRRRALILAVIAVGGLLAREALTAESPMPSGSFCLAFDNLPDPIEKTRRVLDSGPHAVDSDEQIHLDGMGLFWDDVAVEGAPEDLRADAGTLVTGMEQAIKSGDSRPLMSSEFVAAERRLEAPAAVACEGRPT